MPVAAVLSIWLLGWGGHAGAPLLSAEALCGRFEQARTIPQLARPLRSEGRFIISRQLGLAWLQAAPFESLLVVDASRMTQQVGANPPLTITARDNPAMFAFSRVLLQIFDGSGEALEEYFEVSFDQADAGWSMLLVPRASLLKDALQSITVTGQDYIEVIDVRGSQGDDTRIRLTNVVECADDFSDADQRLFELP
jgi:hypothetical protein